MMESRRPTSIFTLAAVGLLAAVVGLGCGASRTDGGGGATPLGPSAAPTATATATPAATPTPTAGADPRTPTPAPVHTLNDFVTALGDQGIRVAWFSELLCQPVPDFSVAGTHLTLSGFSYLEHGIQVFVYPDEMARIDDSSWLEEDLLRRYLALANWAAEPHLYARENLFILLISDDAIVITAVEEAVAMLDAVLPSDEIDDEKRTPAPSSRLYTLDDFVSALSDLDVPVESSSKSEAGARVLLNLSVDATDLTLSGFSRFSHDLKVFVYTDEATRIEASAWLGDRCNLFPAAQLIAEAHLYERGNLLALIITNHKGLVAAVEQAVATLR